MDTKETFEVVSIDAWREPMGGWTWDDQYTTGVEFEVDPTPRKLFRELREWGLLTEASIGNVQMEDCETFIEVQNRRTGEPLFALYRNMS